MAELIKSDMYRIKSNIGFCVIIPFVLLIGLGVAFAVAFMQVGSSDIKYTFKLSFEWIPLIAIIVFPVMIYFFMQDYFESRSFDSELISGHKEWRILLSKIIVVTSVISIAMIFVVSLLYMVFALAIGEDFLMDFPARIAFVFIICIRICNFALLSTYLLNNFFAFVATNYVVWIVVSSNIKYKLFGVDMYKFTYQFQIKLISSFGANFEILLKRVAGYSVISMFIELSIMFFLTYEFLRYRHRGI